MKSFAFAVVAGLGAALSLVGCTPPDNSANSSSRNSTNESPSVFKDSSPLVATVILSPATGSNVRGTVNFFQSKDTVRVEASLTGLTPGLHGFHIHEKGDCSVPDASSAGGHFNPTGMQHGAPTDASRHTGDFGNLEADAQGNARYAQSFPDLKLDGANSILGKAMIVHAKADDLKTQPSGDAGERVACGVIEKK